MQINGTNVKQYLILGKIQINTEWDFQRNTLNLRLQHVLLLILLGVLDIVTLKSATFERLT